MDIDHESCYRALVTRDARFDGLFFVGVATTRIYCRPICSARTPRADRCRFFPLAAAAEEAGFRPCLRCRPELSPGHASVDAVGRLARAAAARIEAGALDGGGTLDGLAAEFGLGARQLRRAIGRELGVSPVRLAQTHRLLLAKRLLTETGMPIIEVALASGFESLRRFNALFQSRYRMPPSRFRKSPGASPARMGLRLRMAYRPPLAWAELLGFLRARAIAGVERVVDGGYERVAEFGAHRGWLRVEPGSAAGCLSVEFADSLAPALAPLLAGLRHLFDLDARPDAIAAHLAVDGRLGAAVARCPGLRVPGAFDGFELAWRAILGQRVSVRAATTVAGRLAAGYGEPIEVGRPGLDRLSPRPERVADAGVEDLAGLGLGRDRASTIKALARAVADGQLRLGRGVDAEAAVARLREIPGIGEWTAQYIAMRALAWPDAFPHGDLILRRRMGDPSPSGLREMAEAWRPWRSYAAMHLWNGPTGPDEGGG